MSDKKIVLNILIACEESQAECVSFRKQGHNAYSCDLQPCRRGGRPEWHIQGNVTSFLKGNTQFVTMDGKYHRIPGWDVIISHPPCTFLCRTSSLNKQVHSMIDVVRMGRMLNARRFFMACLEAQAHYVAVECPIPIAAAKLPEPSAFIQPFWCGGKYSKKIFYWLNHLPPLISEIINPNFPDFVNSSEGEYGLRTFPQLAAAMAKQWSDFIIEDINRGFYVPYCLR